MNLLFDHSQFQSLMTDFYIITNIKIVFYDRNLRPVIAVPEYDCEFCAAVKENPDSLACCEACIEREVAQCKKTNQLHCYRCHCGLTEAVAPVWVDDILVGYIMFGQIMDEEDRQQNKEEILSYVSSFATRDMEPLFDAITCKNQEQIRSVATFVEACISYLIMHRLVRKDQTSLAFRITHFINTNLTADLSVEQLCATFSLSRSALYRLFRDCCGMSVAKYIRKKRIQAAAQWIREGMSVTEASGRAGFPDYNYFSKVFKSETGVLPSKWRKQDVERKEG